MAAPAFQLANLFIDVVVRNNAALNAQMAGIKAVVEKMSVAPAKVHWMAAGMSSAAAAGEQAQTIWQKLGGEVKDFIQTTMGFDLAQIWKLGTIAGAVTLIGLAVMKFRQESTYFKVLGERMKIFGLDAETGKEKVREFGEAMESLGMDKQSAFRAVERGIGNGLSVDAAMAGARAGFSLANALGISEQRAGMLVQRYQQMGSLALRREGIFRAMVQRGASEIQIQQKLNELIEKGNQIAKFKMDNTLSGALTKMKMIFENTGLAIGRVFGPGVVQVLSLFAGTLGFIVKTTGDLFTALSPILTPLATIGTHLVFITASMKVWPWITAGFAAMRSMVAGLVPAFAGGAVAAKGFWKAVGGPIFWIAEAIMLLVEYTVGWGAVFETLKPIFEAVMSPFKALFGWIREQLEWLGVWKPGNKEVHASLLTQSQIEPGVNQKAKFEGLDALWKNISLAALGMGQNYARDSFLELQKISTNLANIAVNGMNVNPPAQPAAQPAG